MLMKIYIFGMQFILGFFDIFFFSEKLQTKLVCMKLKYIETYMVLR